jgi:hypothetical protein
MCETFVLSERQLLLEMEITPLLDSCEVMGLSHKPHWSEAALQERQVR